MNYEEAVVYLLDIPRFAEKSGLDNLKGLLEELGNPHKTGIAIHVAGTNGKGSVCAFLASILSCAGYRVGMFTSPHLVKINERFRIQDTMIGNEEFLQSFQRVMEAVRAGKKKGYRHPSFFEFLFLMAACWFEKQKPDYIIYETGLGGRLDATNVLEPCLTVLTAIGMDHMEYLGERLEEIAGEKAGIMKKGTPCVYLRQADASSKVIEKRGKDLGIDLIPVENKKIRIDETREEYIDFSYLSQYDSKYPATGKPITYRVRTSAIYQVENAALAIEAGTWLLAYTCPKKADRKVNKESADKNPLAYNDISAYIQKGIFQMHWQGRMEELEPGIYVDGAHNEPAIRAFCRTLTSIYRDKKIILLFAVARDKRYNEMIRILCETVSYERIIVTTIEGDRETPVEKVAEQFRQYTSVPVVTEQSVGQALKLARSCLKENSRVFCVGSLYLVGHLKKLKEE